jgi:hypothetical protein
MKDTPQRLACASVRSALLADLAPPLIGITPRRCRGFMGIEKDKAAEEHHDCLSEFCHPNTDAFANRFEWEERYSNAIERIRCRCTRRSLPRKPQSRSLYQTLSDCL